MIESAPKTESPPPLYENDTAWSPDRVARIDAIHKAIESQSKSREELISDVANIIKELEAAVRGNPKAKGGNVITQSELLGQMLFTYFHLHQGPDWEVK